MTSTIRISLERVRARQYKLCVEDWDYGEFMSYQKARGLADFFHSLLLQMQEIGIIDESIKFEIIDNAREHATG